MERPIRHDEVHTHVAAAPDGRRCSNCGVGLVYPGERGYTPGAHVEQLDRRGPNSSWLTDNKITCSRSVTNSREQACRLLAETWGLLRNGRVLTAADRLTLRKAVGAIGTLLVEQPEHGQEGQQVE